MTRERKDFSTRGCNKTPKSNALKQRTLPLICLTINLMGRASVLITIKLNDAFMSFQEPNHSLQSPTRVAARFHGDALGVLRDSRSCDQPRLFFATANSIDKRGLRFDQVKATLPIGDQLSGTLTDPLPCAQSLGSSDRKSDHILGLLSPVTALLRTASDTVSPPS